MLYLDDAVIDINSPMDYRYMKLLRVVLRIISGWPGRELGEKTMRFEGMVHAYYNTILSLVYLVSGLWYLLTHIGHMTFFELGHMYIVLLMNMLSTSRACTLCLSKKYRAVAKTFILETHLFFHKDKSDYAMKIYKKVHKVSHFFAIYLTMLMFCALGLFNMIPVYSNYQSGKYSVKGDLQNTTYEHSIYIKFPFNDETNFKGYIAATMFNWYGSYLCASSVCMFDLFLSIMVFNLWGHFKILIQHLETFPKPKSSGRMIFNGVEIIGGEKYSKSELAEVSVKLKECIVYHRLIFNFTKDMSDAFGMALFIYYVFHQISGCLLLLECSQMSTEALMRYLPLTIMMFQQLIQLSVIFETIGSMSEKLKDAVYAIPWEYMDTTNAETVLIFLINVQEPIHVNAGGLVTVGVTTMASIIKTSLSYFTFLRTVSQ